jgi:uncharacterized protein (TIGR02679 family)
VEANGLSLDGGPLTLKTLTHEEADAIAGLLGVHRPANGAVRVPLADVDAALRSSVVGCGLLDVLSALGGPLVDRRAAKARVEGDRAQLWSRLATHPAVLANPALGAWLDHIRTTGLARRLGGGDEGRALGRALDTLAAVAADNAGLRLAVLAAQVTGDAHGLDRGKPAGTLAVHALSWSSDQPFPRDAADWRRTWSEAGVACDDLSCDVLVLNLPGGDAQPLRLTLRQVTSWRPGGTAGGVVFVTENPAVVAAAADRFGDSSPPMVCLDGMPSTAALMILDGLVGAGWSAVYHGDFDWRGLAIASVLARKIPPARPWRFGAVDYRRALDRGLGSVALSGHPSSSPWDVLLAPAMREAGVAVYEEQVIAELLSDLSKPPDRKITTMG